MFKGSAWFLHRRIKIFLVTKPPKCPLSLVNILDIPMYCDNEASPPSGEPFLHHNSNLLDANLDKNVSGTDKANFKKLELIRLEATLKFFFSETY